ncbi:MAG TPA: cell filamentation protein Fic [Clostridiales bacterium]|nr:cell filamentation protein Fic [Clostridiales bacterium]
MEEMYDIMNEDKEKTLLNVFREQKGMRLSGSIYHETQIKLCYNTNRIEGSMLSEDQTRYIYETNTVIEGDTPSRVDDIVETANHFKLFDIMLDKAKDMLTDSMIKEFHEVLKRGTSDERKDWFIVGDYKTLPNEVGGKETTAPERVAEEMAKLLTWYNGRKEITLDEIIEFHYRFESIHPFQDGNGRVGRIIMFKECLKHNIIPFVIEDTQKAFYYRGLKEYGQEKGYLRDTCLSMQDKYKAVIEKFGVKL